MNLSKCQERLSQPGHGVFILPLPVTSRYIKNAYLTDCPLLNSKVNCCQRCLLGRRTIRQGPADRPREGRGLSALSTRAHPVLSSFEVNNGPSGIDPRTVRPEANFLEKLCHKPHVLNKSQKPAECPPQGPGLSVQHLKLDFSQNFQRNPFNK
jgi:hypothetical protein